ncbi:MAG: endonuclease/exonuclease/phosphatase family protein [Muribaculaceae bacterium]|nr:endonuclease/exonuclease/phosphatase family protein [Muribaculaceae bacterium]
MNRSFRLVILVLLLMVAGTNTVFSADVAEFNVATYNLRQQNDDDSARGDGWQRRCPVIANLIRFHEFNIFGTQEGFKNQLEDLKALLPGYEYTGVAREDGKETGEHSAIFYDTNMFELLDHGDFWLSETPDRPGLGWDAACVRICSWGKFRHKETGKEFQFFNLHLDHVGKQARVESVLLVQKKMKEIGLNMPTFLTGDFNVDQTHDMYAVLSSSDFLADSFKTADFVYALNGTFNDYRTDGFTDSRIDHIFVTDDIAVEKYGVLTDTYRTSSDQDKEYTTKNFPEEVKLNAYRSRVPSDHFPVKIKVKIQ